MEWCAPLGRVSQSFARFLPETAADGESSNGTVRVRLALWHEEISELAWTEPGDDYAATVRSSGESRWRS